MIKSHDIITVRGDKSQVIEGNPMFQSVGGKRSYTSESLFYIPDHWHEDMEFLYVHDGSMDYVVNGKEIRLNAGEGIFVNSRRIHSNASKLGEHAVFTYRIIHPSQLCGSPYIMQQYIQPALSINSFDYIILNQNDWTKGIVDRLIELEELPLPSKEISSIELGLYTMSLFYENIDFKEHVKSFSPIHMNDFQKMMNFISGHYMEKISLEDIAESANIGKTLCTKLFKKYVAKTPGEYLISYRITKSLEMLNTSDMSVTDIAYASGFNSASHYTKTFREVLGCTPLKYKSLSV